jgi:hypothetical protein
VGGNVVAFIFLSLRSVFLRHGYGAGSGAPGRGLLGPLAGNK